MSSAHERRVKIVCTIGPASREPQTLAAMLAAGMDVARLNFSHGTHAEHAEVIARLRAAAEAVGVPVAILQDLSGPKIRLGELPGPRQIQVGEELWIGPSGADGALPVRYPTLCDELSLGDRLSLADGAVELEVQGKRADALLVRALSAGVVTSHKGVNLPSGGRALPALTEKDAADLRFGLEAGVDWVALSFVRAAADRGPVARVMGEAGRSVPVLAKVEKPQAVAASAEVLAAFDGVMVARGDLGVEIPYEEVPFVQARLISEARAAAKPVVVATQMLLSMVQQPRPTRAEVSDVAHAALGGADAVMLSEETAVGKHPVAAVAAMARILTRVGAGETMHGSPAVGDAAGAVAHAAWELATLARARLIITPTTSGATARRLAATRPAVPVVALTSETSTAAELALSWGVTARLAAPFASTDELFARCRTEAAAHGLGPGDRVVVTAGLPIEVRGTTNLVHLVEL